MSRFDLLINISFLLDKDTVERTILTLKSLYPLTCDTDEKKRAYISAKMPFNIPNTVC
jgi:hypothetical protein